MILNDDLTKKIRLEKMNYNWQQSKLDFFKITNHRNTMQFLDTNLSSNLIPTIMSPMQVTKIALQIIYFTE